MLRNAFKMYVFLVAFVRAEAELWADRHINLQDHGTMRIKYVPFFSPCDAADVVL